MVDTIHSADHQQVGETVGRAVQWSGQVRGLVNCAGNHAKFATLEMTPEQWHRVGLVRDPGQRRRPGYIQTPMIARAMAEGQFDMGITKLHAIERLGTPDEVARAVVFLLVDGGFSARKVPW